MNAAPIELVVAAFDGETKANQVLQALKELQHKGVVGVINAAVMTKDANGQTALRETEDIRAPQGALVGAIGGALVGLLGGLPGAIVGAAAGAAAGGLAANKIDLGFDDDVLKEIQSSLPNDSSAIIALVRLEWLERVLFELERNQARLFRRMLSDELAAQVEAERALRETDGQEATGA